MKLNLKKIKDFLKFNSWHLFIKILVLFIKICPFKAALIEFVAYVRVTTYFIFKYKRHKKRRRNRILNIKRF